MTSRRPLVGRRLHRVEEGRPGHVHPQDRRAAEGERHLLQRPGQGAVGLGPRQLERGPPGGQQGEGLPRGHAQGRVKRRGTPA